MRRILAELTFWRNVAIVILAAGLYATVLRFAGSLGVATHLHDGFPWGLWIGFDVMVGVGLAAGGFTITAAVHIFQLERFRPIVRPTVLTAFLGYLLVIAGLLFDLGQPWRIWHPLIMWNPHSVMFEVAWCVTLYTVVLSLEFSPMLLERLEWRRSLRLVKAITVPVVICGVLLSTLHQSSLGTLYVIVPDKLHGLWYSPLLPVFFFFSALAAGLAMVIVESSLSSRAFGRRLEADLLREIGRIIVVVLALYLVIKLQDMLGRNVFSLLASSSSERFLFLIEMGFGALVPMILLMVPAVRRDHRALFGAALLVVLGFVLGRLNVAITGMQAGASAAYFPSFAELVVSAMLVVLGFIAFALAVRYLNVFPRDGSDKAEIVSTSPTPASCAVGGVLAALAVVLIWGYWTIGVATAIPARGQGPEASYKIAHISAHFPDDIVYAAGEESPGEVTFSHETHAELKPPNCTTCHKGDFPLLGTAATAAPRRRGEVLHETKGCGRCHDGEDAFPIDGECESCHVE